MSSSCKGRSCLAKGAAGSSRSSSYGEQLPSQPGSASSSLTTPPEISNPKLDFNEQVYSGCLSTIFILYKRKSWFSCSDCPHLSSKSKIGFTYQGTLFWNVEMSLLTLPLPCSEKWKKIFLKYLISNFRESPSSSTHRSVNEYICTHS